MPTSSHKSHDSLTVGEGFTPPAIVDSYSGMIVSCTGGLKLSSTVATQTSYIKEKTTG